MNGISTLAQLITRAGLGLGFLLPILDRVGILGPNDSAGVTWGDWTHFVEYTNSLIPFANSSMANIAGFMATLAEGIFAIGLLIGFKIKWMALGSALITFIFGICMMFSLGINAPFNYPVFVFTGAALLLSVQKDFRWSVDYLLNKRR